MTLLIARTGCIRVCLAVLLAYKNKVVVVDALPERIAMVNVRKFKTI